MPKYQTAYAKNRVAKAGKQVTISRVATGISLGLKGLGALKMATGNFLSGGAALVGGTVIGGFADFVHERAKGSRAKAFAIEHLSNRGRAMSRSSKQIEANAHGVGVVKGHYARSANGKIAWVKQYQRSIG